MRLTEKQLEYFNEIKKLFEKANPEERHCASYTLLTGTAPNSQPNLRKIADALLSHDPDQRFAAKLATALYVLGRLEYKNQQEMIATLRNAVLYNNVSSLDFSGYHVKNYFDPYWYHALGILVSNSNITSLKLPENFSLTKLLPYLETSAITDLNLDDLDLFEDRRSDDTTQFLNMLENSKITSLSLTAPNLNKSTTAFNAFCEAMINSNLTSINFAGLGNRLKRFNDLPIECFNQFCAAIADSKPRSITIYDHTIAPEYIGDIIATSEAQSRNGSMTPTELNQLQNVLLFLTSLSNSPVSNNNPEWENRKATCAERNLAYIARINDLEEIRFAAFHDHVMTNGPDIGIDAATAFINALTPCITSHGELITFRYKDNQRLFDRLLLAAIDKASFARHTGADALLSPTARLTALKYLILSKKFPEQIARFPLGNKKSTAINERWDKAISTVEVSDELKAIICAIDPTAREKVKSTEMMARRPGR